MKNNHVVIMAGGLGTRAQSIDASIPKPLIPILTDILFAPF